MSHYLQLDEEKTNKMNIYEAWQAVFKLSNGNQWVKIPEKLQKILGLDSRLGILGATLCTSASAKGAMLFIARLNRERKH